MVMSRIPFEASMLLRPYTKADMDAGNIPPIISEVSLSGETLRIETTTINIIDADFNGRAYFTSVGRMDYSAVELAALEFPIFDVKYMSQARGYKNRGSQGNAREIVEYRCLNGSQDLKTYVDSLVSANPEKVRENRR